MGASKTTRNLVIRKRYLELRSSNMTAKEYYKVLMDEYPNIRLATIQDIATDRSLDRLVDDKESTIERVKKLWDINDDFNYNVSRGCE